MKTISLKLLLIALSAWFFTETHAQLQTFKPSRDSYIEVTGTSTLHDWEMRSENIVSEVSFKMNYSGQPENLESLVFRLNKNSLKSKQSGLDKRAYDALKTNRFPEITFRMNGDSNIQKSGDNYNISSGGELTIAGVTRQIRIDATCINGDEKKLVCTGTQNLKMTDFNIDPPVMMLGALRTADEIKINYSVVYSQ